MRRIVLFSLTLVIGLACVGLGFWQLGRLSERRAANAAARAGLALPELRADSGRGVTLAPHRRLVVVGTLDESREFVLRNRLLQGVPAIQVVTPLRISGSDTALLVNRGYVPAPDAVDPGAATWSEPGERTFHGVLLPMPDRGDGDPIERRGRESWHGLDLRTMRSRLPYPAAPVYLLAEADSGTSHTIRGRVYPIRAELPPMDEGPHLMYAVQWFGIALAVMAFGVVFVLMGAGRRSTVDGPG